MHKYKPFAKHKCLDFHIIFLQRGLVDVCLQCSGAVSASVLKNSPDSVRGLSVVPGFKHDWLHAKQVPYLLYYLFEPRPFGGRVVPKSSSGLEDP